MKYNVGDRVKIKSLDWYYENKDKRGNVSFPYEAEVSFTSRMTSFCGQIVTISKKCYSHDVGCYLIREDCGIHMWTDEMIEGLVEEKISYDTESEWLKHEISLPDGYIFKDENGNVINATKIVLEKKKKEYPKTYEECEKVLRYDSHRLNNMGVTVQGYKWELIRAFQMLLICRDAYWKIAGEEMGLGKPWKPSRGSKIYFIGYILSSDKLIKDYADDICANVILSFPTKEMRDAFYENFKGLINECKELL